MSNFWSTNLAFARSISSLDCLMSWSVTRISSTEDMTVLLLLLPRTDWL